MKKRAATTSDKGPPPVSFSRRWDKAKWHLDGPEPAADEAEASEHILEVMAFLKERKQLTASGERELADGASSELALLGPHVRPGARAFLDATYNNYLAEYERSKPRARTLLDREWTAYAARYDVDARPIKTPYQALLLVASHNEPTLEDLLQTARYERALIAQLAAVIDHVPPQDAARVSTYLEVARLLAEDRAALARFKLPARDLLASLANLDHPDILSVIAKLAARAEREPGGLDPTTDDVIANAINGRPRKKWLALGPGDRKRLRDALHRALGGKEPSTALFALRTAADASSLKRLEPTLADEGIEETYRETRRGVEVAKSERSHDRYRRAIAAMIKRETKR